MIAMTMLPDMVVVVLEGLWRREREAVCEDSDGVGDESLGWWWFMREMCFLSVCVCVWSRRVRELEGVYRVLVAT
jgi:hypothetical protein